MDIMHSIGSVRDIPREIHTSYSLSARFSLLIPACPDTKFPNRCSFLLAREGMKRVVISVRGKSMGDVW